MRRTITSTFVTLLIAALAPGAGVRAAEDCSWPMYGHDLAHSSAQTDECSAVNPLTVATLRPKWFYPTFSPVTASPAVVDGVVYVGAADGTFYAMPEHPAPGPVRPYWTFTVKDNNRHSYGKIVSSAAVETVDGTRIVAFGGGSTLYVLDALTGAQLAAACVDPRIDPPEGRCGGSDRIIEIQSSPSIVPMAGGEVRILVGMDTNEQIVGRAGLLSFRLTHDGGVWDLDPVWKFDPEKQVAYTTDASKDGVPGFVYTPDPLTFGGRGHGCGNVWTSPTVDVEADVAYFATANCSTSRLPPDTEGEFGGEAIWAIGLSDGALRWCHRPRPVNDLDLDFGASPNLLPGGLVGEAGKDGFYYAFERTHEGAPDLECASPEPEWKTDVSTSFGFGGMIGTPAIGQVRPPNEDVVRDAIFATSAIPVPEESSFEEPRSMMALRAIDARTGEVLWWAANPAPSFGSASYVNGVVLIPDTFSFSVQAYHADTGALLWAFPLNGPPSSTPVLVGRSMYMGTGTTVDPFPFKEESGIWAFELTAP